MRMKTWRNFGFLINLIRILGKKHELYITFHRHVSEADVKM
jgi:hypothetical protein